ncbi:MAG TPA: NifB/NifX family molybdenum-iron cluster-binding protein [Candidatus Paceibacterota bacterium]|nr:NifB/NifX family molybdenum-iron cluster-binding protein [Candidatus Paceibacterota bacterium]
MNNPAGKRKQSVTVAISIIEGQRLGHLGEARQFALLEVDPQSRAIIRSQVVNAPPHAPGSFPGWLRERDVRAVIVAGIGQRALDNLNHHGIEVRIGGAGGTAESLVAGWLTGQPSRLPNGCVHRRGETADHECQLAACLEEPA